jgi:hypothetical protein
LKTAALKRVGNIGPLSRELIDKLELIPGRGMLKMGDWIPTAEAGASDNVAITEGAVARVHALGNLRTVNQFRFRYFCEEIR